MREVVELRPGIYQDGWLGRLKELGTSTDHPAWTATAPEVAYSNPPEP